MNRKYVYIAIVLLLLIALLVRKELVIKSAPIALSYKDATYMINGESVTLVNGVSEQPTALGSASKITTRIFGNEAYYDFNNDGRADIAFLITQNSGGSGTFFYVVAALNKETAGYVGSDAVLLGDRIAPQTTEITKDGIVLVNYADRAPGESFAVQPSIGKSIWLKLDTKTMQFGEVAQNFEGESDPARMTLDMTTWRWVATTYSNTALNVLPRPGTNFAIIFTKKGTFSATTDCNNVSGGYVTSGNKITFSKMISTLMYCNNSQESAFVKMLSDAQTYKFTSKGELILGLKTNGGLMTFR